MLCGVISPIASPILLAKELGVPGFFAGLLLGVVVGAGFVTTGAGICYYSLL